MDILKPKIVFSKPPVVPLMKTQKPKNNLRSIRSKNNN